MRRIAMVGLMTAGLVLVGCGSSDSGGASAKTPTKAAYLKDGDAICKKAGDEYLKELDKSGVSDTQDNKKIAAFITGTFVPNTQGQIDDLRELGYPKGDQPKLEKIFTDAEKLLDDVKADPESFIEKEDPFKPVNDRLKAYGFKECGS